MIPDSDLRNLTAGVPARETQVRTPKSIPIVIVTEAATDEQPTWRQTLLKEGPGFAASFLLHLAFLLILAWMVIPGRSREQIFTTLLQNGNADGDASDLEAAAQPQKLEAAGGAATPQPADMLVLPQEVVPVPVEVPKSDVKAEPKSAAPVGASIKIDDMLGGRSTAARAGLAATGGGSPGSERAVNAGLKWLLRHQRSDGSWNFDHGGRDDPGTLTECTTASTALALLCFLGAGHTHKKAPGAGDYSAAVDRGFEYLVSQIKYSSAGADLRGPYISTEGMYAQALATIALCEVYALTRDSRFKRPAQSAVNFIASVQDPRGGGWRYEPGQKGDTSVTGWQIMALTSARIAKLKVPEKTVEAARSFLDSVQTDGGAKYGYQTPDAIPSMTSFALLCRMYLGWTPTNPALQRGVEYLSETGPSESDIYYDYYATQVLHHWGGPLWEKWNGILRDRLVQTQSQAGPSEGSWTPTGDQGAIPGGRLYQTCLSIMTLEVYYRHLPLYQRQATANE